MLGPLLGTLKYITGHELLFLGLSMAAGKASADPAKGSPSARSSWPWRATAPIRHPGQRAG